MERMDNFRERFAVSEQPTEPLQQQPYIGPRWRCWGRYPWRIAAVAVLGLALALPHLAQAETFHCDAGDVKCLIAAINQANANGEQNRIRLEADTYTLTAVDNDTDGPTGLPVITSTLTITGQGPESTIIERDASAPSFRLVNVAATGTLTLRKLTLRGGGGRAPLLGGGGISNTGTLSLSACIVTGNDAGAGGGLFNNSGIVTITRTRFDHNRAGFEGGGLFNFNNGIVTITTTTFTQNGANSGGGLANGATIVLTRSTITENVTAGPGGGIANTGTALLTSTTVARNRQLLPAGGSGVDNNGTLILLNSTIAENTGAQNGFATPGLGTRASGTVVLVNTLLAHNQDVTGQVLDCRGPVTSLGHNLIGNPTGCTITLQPSDLTGEPGLGDFTDNGRPGNGHFPLLPTSQAIDAGNDAVCPLRDQLGQRRVNIPGVGTSRCDIGAIEFPGKDDRPHDEEDDHHDDDDRHDKDQASAGQASR